MALDWSERLEFLLPLIRYHSRWNELTERDFSRELDGFNGSAYYTDFLRTSTDFSSSYCATERTVGLSETMQSALDSLLEYCDTQQLNVLFVQIAGLTANKYNLAEINFIMEIVKDHGYPILSLQPSVEEIGLDITKDYYNVHRPNIHVAIKTTVYISRYLVENYALKTSAAIRPTAAGI